MNKRREELRRGSLERQRIIDDIVNKRKKAEFGEYPGTPSSKQLNATYNSPYTRL